MRMLACERILNDHVGHNLESHLGHHAVVVYRKLVFIQDLMWNVAYLVQNQRSRCLPLVVRAPGSQKRTLKRLPIACGKHAERRPVPPPTNQFHVNVEIYLRGGFGTESSPVSSVIANRSWYAADPSPNKREAASKL